MLSKDDLLNLKKVVKYNKFTLKDLQEFYIEYVCCSYYYFKLDDGKEIVLNFFKENLCHLLAVQKCYPEKMSGHYEGINGYDKIITEEITFDKLISLNKGEFDKNALRVQYFPFILRVLQNAKIVKFNPEKIGSIMKGELIIYDDILGARVHISVIRESEHKNIYSAESFFVRKLSQKDFDLYTNKKDHPPQNIIERKIVRKNNSNDLNDFKNFFDDVSWTSQGLKHKFEMIKSNKKGAIFREGDSGQVALLLRNKVEVVKIIKGGKVYIVYKKEDYHKVENLIASYFTFDDKALKESSVELAEASNK